MDDAIVTLCFLAFRFPLYFYCMLACSLVIFSTRWKCDRDNSAASNRTIAFSRKVT